MKNYEIRNAKNTGFGGNYDHYYDNIALKATSKKAAIAEAEKLQECHDKNHVAEFGHDESFENAPCYVNHIYEFDNIVECEPVLIEL